MKKRLPLRSLALLASALIFFTLSGVAIPIEPGVARIHVLQELGEPSSSMSRGNLEILSYRNGTKITLRDGLVAEIAGLPATDQGSETAAAETRPSAGQTDEEIAIFKAEDDAYAKSGAGQEVKFEQAMAELENRQANPAQHLAPPPFNLVNFIAGLLFKTVITLLAVKLTAKYWGYELLWGGAIIVAVADTAVRTSVTLGGKMLLGLPTVFYADEALSAIIMVMVVKKMSTSQSLNQAIQITVTTKVFTIVAGSFLVTMLLSAIS